MIQSSRRCKRDLPLPLLVSLQTPGIALTETGRTTHTLRVEFRCLIFRADWKAAGVAEGMGPQGQPLAY